MRYFSLAVLFAGLAGAQSVDVLKSLKFRESFRPFAPVVLAEHAHEWFGMRPGSESPYMLLVAPVNEAKRAQARDMLREWTGK